MSLLSNSVYFSVFIYNPNVLTRQYRHFTIKASIEVHHITCVSLNISALAVTFGDQARMCKVDTTMSHQNEFKTFNKSFLTSYLMNCLITTH